MVKFYVRREIDGRLLSYLGWDGKEKRPMWRVEENEAHAFDTYEEAAKWSGQWNSYWFTKGYKSRALVEEAS